MPTSTDHIHRPSLEVAESLRDSLIKASLAELEARRRLDEAVLELRRLGYPVDDISEATGLSPEQIRRVIGHTPELGGAINARGDLAVVVG